MNKSKDYLLKNQNQENKSNRIKKSKNNSFNCFMKLFNRSIIIENLQKKK
jgi:hypothetical protein